MIEGKDKNQIMQLISFIKENPDTVLPTEKKENSTIERKKENITSRKFSEENVENSVKSGQDKIIDKNEENTEKIENTDSEIKNQKILEKKESIYEKARFLSNDSEFIKEGDDISSSNTKSELNQENENKKSAINSQTGNSQKAFIFQDGPIDLNIF